VNELLLYVEQLDAAGELTKTGDASRSIEGALQYRLAAPPKPATAKQLRKLARQLGIVKPEVAR